MLPEIDHNSVAEELKKNTPSRIVHQICELRQISAEAMGKIDREGTVVRTLKGDVVPHPAIKIHADAIKQEESLLKTWVNRALR